jgi:3-keto-disaccharide hydrolase
MVVRKFLFVFLVIALSAGGCRTRQSKDISGTVEGSSDKDSTYLFDGKTLDGWEITNFGPQGPVNVSGDEIILGMGDGCTGITCLKKIPASGYEVTLEAKKVDGNDFFCGLTFPAGKFPCTLIVGGWGGTVVGLSSINGMDASENETTTSRSFEKERWYKIRLIVTDLKIEAWIDSEKVVDFTIGDNILSIRPEVELSKPLGIASWRTTAAIRNIRLLPYKESN